MIPLTIILDDIKHEQYEKHENPRSKFFSDFKIELNGIPLDYFDMSMIIKQEHMKPLIKVVQKYMFDILGITIPNLDVVAYTNADELPLHHSYNIKSKRCCGMDVRGFYVPSEQIVYIRIGEHLKKLLPTLFHELTHAYVKQNGINLIDSWDKKPTGFDFESMMCDASQEEGLCELVASLLCYHIFNCEQYPSNVDEYWLGWRLCIQAFIVFAQMLIKQPNNINRDRVWINKYAFGAIIQHIKSTNNLYKFVSFVPKDAYHRTYGICVDLK